MGRVVTDDGRTIAAASGSGPYWLGKWLQRDGDYRPKIHWVIVGGESGPNARPTNPVWVQSIRDQCQEHEIPFFFKQWGEWGPYDLNIEPGSQSPVWLSREGIRRSVGPMESGDTWVWKPGRLSTGRQLDGVEWSQFPKVRAAR